MTHLIRSCNEEIKQSVFVEKIVYLGDYFAAKIIPCKGMSLFASPERIFLEELVPYEYF